MNSRILLGFLTAHHPSRWHYRQILRAQCLDNSPLPYKFVFGDGNWEDTGLREDEILHAPGSDDKKYLHLKDQALFRYALDEGFDFCFRGCDDSWCWPARILSAGLEAFDYAGQMPCKLQLGGTFKMWFRYWDYAHGGCGIWLSRKAMEKIVNTPWNENYLTDWPAELDIGFGLTLPKPEWYWDDHFIGEALKGSLAWNDPLRTSPLESYTAQGISVFEDEMLFVNDDPERALSIHDPGRFKRNSDRFDGLMNQIKRQNVERAERLRMADAH